MSILSLSNPPPPVQQFDRQIKLIVFNNNGTPDNGIDLSEFRIKFSVKRSDTMTPNVADIRIYNLSLETAQQIRKEFKKVILQAGYPGNFGVIFVGNIKQFILGRESATDTFLDLVAGDGDRGYNFAIVNATLAKGSTQGDQVNASIAAMNSRGVTAGYVADTDQSTLPRGKVMYGPVKEKLRTLANTSESGWSIQNEQVNFLKKTTYLPGERVVLTSKTGMIGAPQQTNIGLNVKCLLNPRIKVAGRIQVDEASVQALKINLTVPLSPENIPAPLVYDGVYYVLVIEHQGDTRGIEWYSNLTCLNVDVTAAPIGSVQVG